MILFLIVLTFGRRKSLRMKPPPMANSLIFSYRLLTLLVIRGYSTLCLLINAPSCSVDTLVLLRLWLFSQRSVNSTPTFTCSWMWTSPLVPRQGTSKTLSKKTSIRNRLSPTGQKLLVRSWFSLLMTWTCQQLISMVHNSQMLCWSSWLIRTSFIREVVIWSCVILWMYNMLGVFLLLLVVITE